MFIGPKGLAQLKLRGGNIKTHRNPIFEIEQTIISDSGAEISGDLDHLKHSSISGTPLRPTVQGDFTRLGDIFSHPELFKAYPTLAGFPVVRIADLPTNAAWQKEAKNLGAAYVSSNADGGFFEFENIQTINSNGLRPITLFLHEIQHAIQDIEGYFAGALRSPKQNPHEDLALYYAHPQEREAFNVEKFYVMKSAKIWFTQQNLEQIDTVYPKRIKELIKDWDNQASVFLKFFLSKDLQLMCHNRAMELRKEALRNQ